MCKFEQSILLFLYFKTTTRTYKYISSRHYFSEVLSEVNEFLDPSVGCEAGDDGPSGVREFVEVGFGEVVGFIEGF